MKLYKCDVCGNISIKLHDGGAPLHCCGKAMRELKAGTTDGAAEKHVPAYTLDGDKLAVEIGEVAHPMAEEHYIEFIIVEQGDRVQYVYLKPGAEPKVSFTIDGKAPFTVYEYCNLHGLWKIDGK